MKSCVLQILFFTFQIERFYFYETYLHTCEYTETDYFIIYEFNIHLPRQRASVNRKLYVLYKTKTSSRLQKIVQKSCIKFNELAQ